MALQIYQGDDGQYGIDEEGNRVSGGALATYLSQLAEAGTSPTMAPPPPDYSSLINQYYQQYLGRTAEPGGMDFWSNQLTNGGMTPEQFQAAIQGSEEAGLYQQGLAAPQPTTAPAGSTSPAATAPSVSVVGPAPAPLTSTVDESVPSTGPIGPMQMNDLVGSEAYMDGRAETPQPEPTTSGYGPIESPGWTGEPLIPSAPAPIPVPTSVRSDYNTALQNYIAQMDSGDEPPIGARRQMLLRDFEQSLRDPMTDPQFQALNSGAATIGDQTYVPFDANTWDLSGNVNSAYGPEYGQQFTELYNTLPQNTVTDASGQQWIDQDLANQLEHIAAPYEQQYGNSSSGLVGGLTSLLNPTSAINNQIFGDEIGGHITELTDPGATIARNVNLAAQEGNFGDNPFGDEATGFDYLAGGQQADSAGSREIGRQFGAAAGTMGLTSGLESYLGTALTPAQTAAVNASIGSGTTAIAGGDSSDILTSGALAGLGGYLTSGGLSDLGVDSGIDWGAVDAGDAVAPWSTDPSITDLGGDFSLPTGGDVQGPLSSMEPTLPEPVPEFSPFEENAVDLADAASDATPSMTDVLEEQLPTNALEEQLPQDVIEEQLPVEPDYRVDDVTGQLEELPTVGDQLPTDVLDEIDPDTLEANDQSTLSDVVPDDAPIQEVQGPLSQQEPLLPEELPTENVGGGGEGGEMNWEVNPQTGDITNIAEEPPFSPFAENAVDLADAAATPPTGDVPGFFEPSLEIPGYETPLPDPYFGPQTAAPNTGSFLDNLGKRWLGDPFGTSLTGLTALSVLNSLVNKPNAPTSAPRRPFNQAQFDDPLGTGLGPRTPLSRSMIDFGDPNQWRQYGIRGASNTPASSGFFRPNARGGLNEIKGVADSMKTGPLEAMPPRLARGPGGGQADKIPALLSDGEYVMDAETVSALGDGSTDAGAKKLDEMRENLRRHKRGASPKTIPPRARAPERYLKGRS